MTHPILRNGIFLHLLIKAVFITMMFCENLHAAFGQSNSKQIRIIGLKIFTEEMLLRNIEFQSVLPSRVSFATLSHALETYLHSLGYTIAKAYCIHESEKEIVIFVDEGRIEKIIFYNLNTPDTLRMRFNFILPKNIYNENIVKEKLQWIKENFNLKSVTPQLKPVRDYSESFFQIDKQLKNLLDEFTTLSVFDEYRPRFDLEIHIERYSPFEIQSFAYGFRTSYSKGLIPFLRYDHPSLIADNDNAKIKISAGIFYGLDRQFHSAPHWTFMEASTHYTFPPFLTNFFAPSISGYFYRSWASRDDLKLSQYEYLIVRGNLSPGIRILNQFNAKVGYGVERVYLYKSTPLEGQMPLIETRDKTDQWTFLEIKINIDVFPTSIRNITQRFCNIAYAYYTNDSAFQKISFNATFELERSNFDIVSLMMNSVLMSPSVPFYYEESVEHTTFKGFEGKSFHTRKIVRFSTSYRFSLYRDYLFSGIFFDSAIFEGSTYDLVGKQTGIVSGISFHIIFLDQFQFNIYYGKDYLFSTNESGQNVIFDFEKRW